MLKKQTTKKQPALFNMSSFSMDLSLQRKWRLMIVYRKLFVIREAQVEMQLNTQ